MRHLCDKSFTVMTYISVGLMTLLLVGILGPMLVRGASAIFFTGTVDFRKMQHEQFGRGDDVSIAAEMDEVWEYRNEVYEAIDSFRRGLDTEALTDEVRSIYREYGEQLRFQNVERDEYRRLRGLAKEVRDHLQDAFVSNDKEQVNAKLDFCLKLGQREEFRGTVADRLFRIAEEYREIIQTADLERREKYRASLLELESLVEELFGPRPGEELPVLIMHQYGATRMDRVKELTQRILWEEQWVSQGEGLPLKQQHVRRSEQFAGTRLEGVFGFIEEHQSQLFRPRFTLYWQYFIDDSTHGYYFGGVGPEVLGTLILTVLGMLFAIPVGIVTAAYLVECTTENMAIRVIRMCINTLAGVPSIVFGLFGLAFFVLFLFPRLHLPSHPCILAASLTLAVLTLPVIIRASEEAIRAVPDTYREASLGLGAGKLSTFVKVTLPAAMPGVLTGIILSLSRIAGETAPILFTGAVAFGPVPKSIFDPTRNLPYGVWNMAVGDRIAQKVPHNQYGMVMTLIVLILLLNTVSIVLRSRMAKKLRGS